MVDVIDLVVYVVLCVITEPLGRIRQHIHTNLHSGSIKIESQIALIRDHLEQRDHLIKQKIPGQEMLSVSVVNAKSFLLKFGQ